MPWHAQLRLRPLNGWILLSDAADRLGISRQAVHRLVGRGTIAQKDLRYLGDDARRPVLIVREAAIDRLPMTPQRRREIGLRGTGDPAGDAGLDGELPGE